MSDKTEISWTDSTFNPWWGCSRVSPGCDHCYAEALDRRTGGNHWILPPKPLSEANWKKPFTWNRKGKRRVFCASMADVFDKNAPAGQRERLWSMIRATPNLTWQLLTKRVPNVTRYLPQDWGSGYANVWLGCTVENRAHGLPRVERLRDIRATVRFLSAEPLLEDLGELDLSGIHWVIVGGESGPGARPMNPEWAENIRAQCERQNVAFFFKQMGGRGHGADTLNGRPYKAFPNT